MLEYGFAYGHDSSALHGKKMLTVITTGGSDDAYQRDGYNRFSIREFLIPFEQTATLCGMRYLPPYVVHGMHRKLEDQMIRKYAEGYREILARLRDNELDLENLNEDTYLNHALKEFEHNHEEDGDA